MQPLTTAPATGVAQWEEPLGERPPVGLARALAAVPVLELLTRVADARDEAALVRAVLVAAVEVADADAAAFVRGADQLVGVRGRSGADATALVLDALDRGSPAHRPGRPHVWSEHVAAPGPAGRLVVVVTRPGAVDPANGAAVRALACTLGLGLRGLAGRARAGSHGVAAEPETLTGLPGRSELLGRIEDALARSGDAAGRIAVLFVDVDRFKNVNDSLGHDAGDELLRLVGQRLRSCVRPADTAAHLEGDEFAVLLTHQGDPEVVAIVAERILAALRLPYRLESVVREAGGAREVHLDASVGIALGDRIIRSAEELLQNADLAMARAKADGRGRFVFYQRGMQEAALTRLELEAGLRHALADGALGVHFQPIHRLADGALVGVEALVRWQHPVLGTVPPSVFVPIAEHTGLIVPIGSWVMARACTQVAAWRASGLSPALRLSVNLSTRQLERPGLAHEVAEVLAASGLPADALILEITESVLLDDVPAASSQLQSLRDLGVRVAIDDFGTGYATLGYLQQLPADILKVDKSFVDDVSAGPAQAALAGAVVQLARSLGLRTTAEGIETPEQLDVLRSLGCDDGQGYLFSRPLPAAALERRLAGPPRG